MDDQHKQFLKIANEVIALTNEKTITRPQLLLALGKFLDYAMYHFESEEGYFKQFDCPQPEHVKAHDAFRERYKKLFEKVETCPEDKVGENVEEAIDLAGNWALKHILFMDKEYTKCFNEHGLK